MGQSYSYPKFQALDDDGNPLEGGFLHTFNSGTNIPLATYSDSTLATANTNPIVLDARGEAWLFLDPAASYRFTLKDAAGATIWSKDGLGLSATKTNVQQFLTDAQLADVIAYTYLVDCTANIQSALDSGLTIKFPAGGYLISGSLTFRDGQSIEGEGSVKTIIKGNLTTPILKKGTSPATMYNVRFSGLTLDNTASSNAGGVGFDFTSVEDAVVEDVIVQNVATGFLLSGAQRFQASGIKMISVVTGANLPSAGAASPQNVLFDHYYVSGATTAFAINQDSHNATIRDGMIYATTTAFAIGAAGAVQGLRIDDAYLHTDVTNVNTIGTGVGSVTMVNVRHASGTLPDLGSYLGMRTDRSGIAFGAGAGVYSGAGAPTFAAPKGSIYTRTDYATTNAWMYLNASGSTAWVALDIAQVT